MNLLKMKRAKLKIQHQDLGIRLGTNDVMGRLEGVDSGVTAHEANHRPFD